MEKVSNKFFDNLGFHKDEYKDVVDYKNHMGDIHTTIKTIYSIYIDDRWAKFEHTYSVYTNKFGDKKVSNYYQFYASNDKTGFKVENDITHIKPTIEQIKAALLVCGIV